ncbi:hypothetical protein N7522_006424 [Penicillium canescens]|nr:hypothetical protein N7522_006424 [Penicillium canescens]
MARRTDQLLAPARRAENLSGAIKYTSLQGRRDPPNYFVQEPAAETGPHSSVKDTLYPPSDIFTLGRLARLKPYLLLPIYFRGPPTTWKSLPSCYDASKDDLMAAVARLDNMTKTCAIIYRFQTDRLVYDYSKALEACAKALQTFTSERLGTSGITLLAQQQSQPAVAMAVRLSIDDINDVLKLVTKSHITDVHSRASARQSVFENIAQILGRPVSLREQNPIRMWRRHLHFVCVVLCAGVISFLGPHVYPQNVAVWQQPVQRRSVGLDYKFYRHWASGLSTSALRPTLVLGRSQRCNLLKFSISFQDLQELWRPVHVLERECEEGSWAVIIVMESGYIIPIRCSYEGELGNKEVECYWTTKIPSHLKTPEGSKDAFRFGSPSRILLTADTKHHGR